LEINVSILFEKLSGDAKSALLLDYVQGRLSATERAEIDLAIAADNGLAEELSYYQAMANANEPVAKSADHEFGWARLSKSIDAETSAPASQPIAANDNSFKWKLATMAFGLIALAQAGIMMSTSAPADSETAVYVPVTQNSNHEVRLIFTDNATNKQIRTLLNQIGAEIVTGPSALGIYNVRFASEAEGEAGLERLREASGIVESATLK